MNQCQLIEELEAPHLKNDIPKFRVGDTLNVYTRIVEGEKERLQMFSGTVIARRGSGLAETVALYRVSYGAGMERVFMIHSPKIARIEIARSGKVRKAKLHHLRGTSGKKSKVEEQMISKKPVNAMEGSSSQEPAT